MSIHRPLSTRNYTGIRRFRIATMAAAVLLMWPAAPLTAQQLLVEYEEYDQWGNLLEASDALGQTVHYFYGSNDNPLSQDGMYGTDGVYLTGIRQEGTPDLETTATYDTLRQITSIIDANGNDNQFDYDGLGRLIEIRNKAGHVITEYEYQFASSPGEANWIRVSEHPSNGADPRQRTDYFDGLGRQIQSQQILENDEVIVSALEYDAAGRLWKEWKPYPDNGGFGYRSDYATDADDWYSSSGDGPDAGGRPWKEHLYLDDPFERLQRIHPVAEDDTSRTVRYSHGIEQAAGQMLHYEQVTDEEGRITRNWQDGWGRTLRQTPAYDSPDSATTEFVYDALDRLLTVTSPNGGESHYRYNELDHLIARTTPEADGSLNGDPTSETGTGSSVDYEYVYDPMGNLRFTLDPNGRQSGELIEYQYDSFGRLTLEQRCSGSLPADHTGSCTPDSELTEYIYDDDTVAPSGFTIDNPLGNLIQVDFPGGTAVFSYNVEGLINRHHVNLDGLDAKEAYYDYNWLGELTAIAYQMSQSDMYFWSYTYDRAGRPLEVNTNVTMMNPPNPDGQWSYVPGGQVSIEVLGSYSTDFEYNARGRLAGIGDVTASSDPFSAAFTYLDNGLVATTDYHQPNSPHSHKRYRYEHSYDNRGQSTEADYNYWNGSGWSASSAFDVSGIEYDTAGNLTDLTRYDGSAVDYEYVYDDNPSGRLSDVELDPGSNISFSYDRNGNVTALGGSYNISAITYNLRNQPLSLTTGSTTYDYRYDHQGHRIYREDGEEVHIIRGPDGRKLAEYRDGSLHHWVMTEPGGTEIGRRQGSDRLYYHRDHLGSVRAVANGSGQVVQTDDYYPFGLQMPGRSMTAGAGSREKFTGHELDEESDLYHMVARSYMPELGRFMQTDPMSDSYPGWNPYHYVLNDPLRLIDPTGMDPLQCQSCQEGETIDSQWGRWQYMGSDSWRHIGTGMIAMSGSSEEVIDYMFTAVDVTGMIGGNHQNGTGVNYTMQEAGNYAIGISFVSGALSYEIGTILNNRSIYGVAHPTTILRTPGLYTPNIPIKTDILRYVGSGLKFAGATAGVVGLGITGTQYLAGDISGVESSFDAAFGVAGFFWPFGTAASVGYFGGKAVYEYLSY
ncbi:MAG: RHS repeat-associated core domain-containing protein [Balneolaceae bacterium]